MREKLNIVLAAAVLLAVGMALGFWLALRRPLPPPALLAGRPEHGEEQHAPPLTPAQVAQFNERLRAIEPDVVAFQTQFAALDDDFHVRFGALLTEAQRPLHADHHPQAVDWVSDFNRMAEGRAGIGGPTPPPLDRLPGFRPHEGRALFALMRILMYEPSLHIMTERYRLTPDQQVQLRILLAQRRQALLVLMDRQPLPLDRLYFMMRDLGMVREEAAHPPAPAHP